MATTFLLLPHLHYHCHSLLLNPKRDALTQLPKPFLRVVYKPLGGYSAPKASINGDTIEGPESPKPSRRGRKKKPPSTSTTTSSSTTATTKRRTKKKSEEKTEAEPEPETETGNVAVEERHGEEPESDIEWEDFADLINFLYENKDVPVLCDTTEAPESPKPSRRGREEKSPSTSTTTSSSTTATTKRRTKKKSEEEAGAEPETGKVAVEERHGEEPESDSELEDFDDGIDFPYEDPPLVCCFGAAQKDFLPMVRVHHEQMHPDRYNTWTELQIHPPEFARAPGGPPSNVAVAHVRLGGRAAFMGKVGDDDFGEEMVTMMNENRVQTRSVEFDESLRTACSLMKVKFGEDGKMGMEMVKEAAEDSLLPSELNLSVLKEARMLHFTSEVLTSPTMSKTLFKAIKWSRKFGGHVFFDPNLPLPLWKSTEETREFIKKAWYEADYIEVSRMELEFLLDDEYYLPRWDYRPQYYARDYDDMHYRRDHNRYTREQIAPLWHDRLKCLFVTDGTLHVHYFGPKFDGIVGGVEDVLLTPYASDRTGSGDVLVAGIMRKLTSCPEMLEDQDVMERQLRFAIAAGCISQWTVGAVRSFPSESAAQNMKERVYIPSMW
ncbi:Fructokinase-like 1, chloroplastic [Turnera subulata]|uniref:Fructokinase-like 1, chloroplastic n=1 Tax=Turnera subulata TaxID=218843 RepID=A0A9Q0FNM2_9ROSI|nr:Fructokinase-like 1, chloroplastic [Turnera subulata]